MDARKLRDPHELPRRDARGRLLEAPIWLEPGWHYKEYGFGGALSRRCGKDGCRGWALRGSALCRHHDGNWRRRRMQELREGTRVPTPAEARRLFWANMRRRWDADPWFQRQTIWLAAWLERRFTADCAAAGLVLAELAPSVADRLRWGWKLTRLDGNSRRSWPDVVAAARARQRKAWPEAASIVCL